MNFRTIHFRLLGLASLFLLGMGWAPSSSAAQKVTKKSTTIHKSLVFSDNYIGGLLGVSAVNEDHGSGVGYNLQGAHYFGGALGVGAFLQGGTHSKGLSSFFYGGQALVRPSTSLPGLQIGVLVGQGRFAARGITGSTSMAYGGKGGYDFALSEHYPITAGIDLNLLVTQPADDTILILSPMASVKIWL